MNVTLIRIDAQDASGGAVPIRLSSHDIPEACHLAGEEWEPALVELPDFALDFFGGGFAGQVTAPRTGFSVATSGLAAFGAVAANRARCADARVRIWVGDITSTATVDLGPLTLRFDGRITGEPDIDDASRTARFDAAVKDSWADKPLLALFAGTGGIEGPADLTGQPEPLTLGNVRFGGGVLIDNVDNIWMVSNGPVQAVNAVYDRLASLGTSAGNFADLAALKAASIPNGSWGTCLALGLVRLGAPPDGRVSFDISGSNSGTGGYVRRAGAIIRRIADLAGGTVNAASLTALDTARPYNLQLQLREQLSAREIVAQLADSVGAVAGVSLTGELFAQALAIGASGEALNPDDSSAQRVLAVEELAKLPPNWRLATEAELTFEVHSADEAAFSYRWQGEWSAARVYRRDDVVTGPDGAAWAYINATPAAGQALPVYPATSNSHWEVFQVSPSAAVAPANANRVPFSLMEGDRGWGVNFNPSSLVASTSYGTASGLRFFRASVTATAASQDFSIGQSSTGAALFVLTPGTRVSVQARLETTGVADGPWRLALFGFTAAGAQSEIASVSGSGLRALTDAAAQMFVDVPAGIIGGRLEFYSQTTGAGAFTVAIAEPMVTPAAAGQTVHPAFSPGPNSDDAADVTATISGAGEIIVDYDSADNLTSPLPLTENYQLVARGGSAFTSGVSWSVDVVSGTFSGTAPSISGTGTGQLSINSGLASPEAQLRVTASIGGASYPPIAVQITKRVAPPTSSGGTGGSTNFASDNTLTAFSTSSFTSVCDDLTIVLPAGVTTATLTASSLTLRTATVVAPTGDTVCEFKWQRESSPGTWVDVGSAATSSPNPGVVEDGDSSLLLRQLGSVTCNRSATGLSAGSTQKFRLVARVSGGNVRGITLTGTVSAQG
jgi:hypothetical protein